MNRQPLYDALRSAGWSLTPCGWISPGGAVCVEPADDAEFARFARILIGYTEAVGDCWECPIMHPHKDGVCTVDGCDCSSKKMPKRWEPKR